MKFMFEMVKEMELSEIEKKAVGHTVTGNMEVV